MKEFIIRKKYWFIGAVIAFLGAGITKIPNIFGTESNAYYQIFGFLIAIIGLFIIAKNLKR